MQEDKNKSLDIKVLGRILAQARPYKKLFFGSIFLAILLAPIGVARPKLINIMVDDYIMQYDQTGLIKMVIILVAFIIFNSLLRYVFIYATNLLGQSVVKDLRVRVYNHIVGLRMRYFDQTPIGRSTTRTINDIETINSVFTQGIITIAADVLSIVVVLAIMFYTSWRLTLICLITMPFLMLSTYVFKEKVKVAFQRVRKEISNMNSFLQERISGMRIIQIFNAERQEEEKFRSINRSYTGANLNAITYYAIFFPVVEIIHYAAIALMVWWGASSFLEGSVSLGALIVFPIYVSMLFRPIRMLADKFNTLQMGIVAAERVFNLLDRAEQIPDSGDLTPDRITGKIEFEDVHFSYDGENEVLKDIRFSMNPGETLAVVGSTGSGKSTIINLLYRFYDIQSGAIHIDDHNNMEYDLNHLRSKIALVLQDIMLFSGTIYDNITLRNSTVSEQSVIEAAQQIGAHEFILQLPGGYDFEVNERGENLSMGQRQLIAFVRALVYNPDILILDEATSSVDVQTESTIQYAIERLIKKRTSIVIAHRLSTIQHADKIMVLSKGRIKELGTPEELLNIEGGHYRKMHELQFEQEMLKI